MSLSALMQLNIRQLQSYNFQLCIYRQDPNYSTTGKIMYRNATQLVNGQTVTLLGVPFIFEPTINTDELVGNASQAKAANIFTLNPVDLSFFIDIRDNDRIFVNQGWWGPGAITQATETGYALPWFAVAGEPKQRPNAGLRTANYQRVLLDPAVALPPLVPGTTVPPSGVYIPTT